MAGGERKARINRFLTKQSEKGRPERNGRLFIFLLRGVADQDHISVRVTSKPGSWLAIKRPVKIPDTLPSEIGELLALGAVEWLEPQIVNSFIARRRLCHPG